MTSPLDDTAGTPRLDSGLSELAGAYDVVFCDVWGVIHNGLVHHASAVDALRRFRRQGGTVVLVTNAPAPARNVVSRLDRLGVPRDTYDAVATSGDVTISMIVAAGCPALFGIGPAGELDLVREAGRIGPRQPRLVAVQSAELVLAIGLADEVGAKPEDYDDLLRAMRSRDLPMICANPDIVVEVGETLVYCAGAVAERYEAMGGSVTQAGKPFPPIYARAFDLARPTAGVVRPDRVLAIGDAMHTDMRGARNQGIDALFITSGIHRGELHGATRDDPLDAATLRQFLDARGAKPVAAMPMLRWSA